MPASQAQVSRFWGRLTRLLARMPVSFRGVDRTVVVYPTREDVGCAWTAVALGFFKREHGVVDSGFERSEQVAMEPGVVAGDASRDVTARSGGEVISKYIL